MAEYIERSVAVNLLIQVENRYNRNRGHDNISAETLYRDLCDAEIQIGKTPVADVAPVVHGYWKTRKVHGINYRFCSVCGEYRPALNEFGKVSKRVYCPNCGAKMDKEAHDEQ